MVTEQALVAFTLGWCVNLVVRDARLIAIDALHLVDRLFFGHNVSIVQQSIRTLATDPLHLGLASPLCYTFGLKTDLLATWVVAYFGIWTFDFFDEHSSVFAAVYLPTDWGQFTLLCQISRGFLVLVSLKGFPPCKGLPSFLLYHLVEWVQGASWDLALILC